MATFNRDNFTFFDGFFKNPVFNFDPGEVEKKIEYIKKENIKNVSFDSSITDFSFLKEMTFIEEIYFSENITADALYHLKDLKRIIVNIEKGKLELDFSNFPKLEYLSIDWFKSFPDLSQNKQLKALHIWKFKPKSKSFKELNLPNGLQQLQITESNIVSFEGLNITTLNQFEAHYCNSLESLKGISTIKENLMVLNLDYCKKLVNYEELQNCKKLEKLIIGDCGDLLTIKWLNRLKNIKHFSFWGTKLVDGDTSPCFGIDYVSFKDLKHYNHKENEFIQ